MINYKPDTQEYKVDHIDDLNGGIDLIADPRQLDITQATDTSNVIFTAGGFKQRPGVVQYLSSNASFGAGNIIYGMGKLSGLRWFRAAKISGTTKLQYSESGAAWADVTGGGLSNISTVPTFVEGNGIKSTADSTGNVVVSATSRSITMAATLTVNAQVGKYIKVTSGTGSGQVCLITTNTVDTLTIEGTFDITPSAADTFSIFQTETVLYMGDGNNAYRKIVYDNTVTPVSGAFNFSGIEWHKNKLWGTRVGRIYFSNIGTGDYVGPNNYIEVGTYAAIPVIKSLGDRLVIYTDRGRYDLFGDNPDNFQVIPRGEKSLSNRGINYFGNVANGVNTQYFISPQGLESLAMVENSSVSESIPISINIMLLNQFGDNALVEVYNNRVYVFNSITQYGTDPIRVYIYDIGMSIAKGYSVWSFADLPKAVTAVYFEKRTSKLYFAYDGVLAYFDESVTFDWDSNFSTTYTSGRRTQGDRERYKLYRKCRDVFTVSRSGTMNIYAGVNGATPTLVRAEVFT